MPHNRPTITPTGLAPVPVGLFLTPPRTFGDRHGAGTTPVPAAPGLPNWHGLSPNHLAYLIRRYTRFGDVVLDIDAHPTAVAATRYLRRVPARAITSRHGPRVRLLPPPPGCRPRSLVRHPGPGADLILAALPRAGAHSLDPHAMTTALATWRPLLRPGGHLLVGLTAWRPQPKPTSYRSTVIAAARAAGLRYQQHIPVVLIPLPEHEPRTDPERPDEADDGRRLLAGRHLPAFRDLLVFASTATGEECLRA